MADIAAIASDIALLFQARVPTGGASGQALIKASGDDHDMAWGDVASGDGASGPDAGGIVPIEGSVTFSKYWRLTVDGVSPAQVWGLQFMDASTGGRLQVVAIESPNTAAGSPSLFNAAVAQDGSVWQSTAPPEGDLPGTIVIDVEFEKPAIPGRVLLNGIGADDVELSSLNYLQLGSAPSFGAPPTAEVYAYIGNYGHALHGAYTRSPAIDVGGTPCSAMEFDPNTMNVSVYGTLRYIGAKPVSPNFSFGDVFLHPDYPDVDLAARLDESYADPKNVGLVAFANYNAEGAFVVTNLPDFSARPVTYSLTTASPGTVVRVPDDGDAVLCKTNPTYARLPTPMGGGVALYPMGSAAPDTGNAPGGFGAMTTDGTYLYICVAPDTWKRVALEAIP